MPTQKIETIPFDASVKMEIPGSFYARLQQLVVSYSMSKTPEEMQKALKKLATNEDPADEFEYHLHTLMILVHTIEKEAKKQNLLKLEDMEIPEG